MSKQFFHFVILTVVIGLLFSACGGTPAATQEVLPSAPQATAIPVTVAPARTSTPEIPVTRITIDGDAQDWDQYLANPSAPSDVPDGAVDIVNVQAFNNDKYLYLAITQQDQALIGKYAAVVRTDGDEIPDFYIGFQPGQSGAAFAPFDSQNFANAVEVEFAQGEIVEVKIPLALFNGQPVLYVHLQTEFNGPAVDGFDFIPQMTGETEPAVAVASAAGSTTSGLVVADETWSGEVHLTGDIFLAGGVTLTIEPGTTVYLTSNSDDQHSGIEHYDEYISEHNDPVGSAEWDQNAIRIDGRGGTLHFVGTAENPIVFMPEGNSTSSAQWDGIYIERGTIQYSKVLYAGRTAIQPIGYLGEPIEIAYNEVRFYHWAGIDSHTQNVWIHHNVIEGGGHQGISVASGNLVEYNVILHAQGAMNVQANGAIIRNNIVVDCSRGVQIGGLTPAGSEITVVNNTFLSLDGPPDGWYYQGQMIYQAFDSGGAIELYNSGVVLNATNNLIVGPYSWGIGLHTTLGAGSLVDYNLIWDTGNNFEGSAASSAGGNNIFADPLLTFNNATLRYQLAAGSPAIDAGAPGDLDDDSSPADLGALGGEFAYGW